MSVKVPFLPLSRINAPFREQIDEAFRRILDKGWYLLGDELSNFEKEWAAYCGTDQCVGVGSGLDALQLVLEAWKQQGLIRIGDEVLVPAHTFFASFLAVSRAGLIPVPVDVDAQSGLIDCRDLKNAISNRTRVIMPVHLYGFLCPMAEINAFARTHDLLILEDAAQAHGARLGEIHAGALSDAAAFSFYPGKNLGCMGDGGAVVTNDAVTADLVRILRNYGMSRKYQHDLPGFNSRLDEFQAAVLRIKLRNLDAIRAVRHELAMTYLEMLAGVVQLPVIPPGQTPAWHLFVVRTGDRNQLKDRLLTEHQIESLIHYPALPVDQPGCPPVRRRECSVAEKFARNCLSLPLHEQLSNSDVVSIADAVIQSVRGIGQK